MRLIGRSKISDLLKRDSDEANWLKSWTSEVAHANWKGPTDVVAQYPAVTPENGTTFLFSVCGTAILEVSFSFERHIACIIGFSKK